MSDTLERGREALENWGNWSRLDSSDTGFPSQCSYYTPPQAGDVWDGAEDKPPIDTAWAIQVEAVVVGMGYEMRKAVRLRYVEQFRLDRIARAVRMDRQKAEGVLMAAEKIVGRLRP